MQKPKIVLHNKDIKFKFQTDHLICAKKSDPVIMNMKISQRVDIVGQQRVQLKESEKAKKNKKHRLCKRTESLQNMDVKYIPNIIELGTVPRLPAMRWE